MSIHPIVHIAARTPQLLVEHAKAYGDLLLAELRHTLTSLVVHAVLYIGAAALAVLGVLFGGVSLLVYGTATGDPRHGWLLIAVPVVPLILSAAFFAVARRLPVNVTLGVVEDQLKADIAMLHEARLP
jgi:hypothetical protein